MKTADQLRHDIIGHAVFMRFVPEWEHLSQNVCSFCEMCAFGNFGRGKRRRVSAKLKRLKVVERKLGRERAWGQCWQGEGLIEIDPRQPAQDYLDTLIHEHLHVLMPDADEREIFGMSRQLTHAIWKAGYRRLQK